MLTPAFPVSSPLLSPTQQTQHTTMDAIFPEAHTPLAEYDPEVYGIIEDEKARQW